MRRLSLGLVSLGTAGALAVVPLGPASAAQDPVAELRETAASAPAAGDVRVRPQGRAVKAVAGTLPPQIAYSVIAANGSAVVRFDPRNGQARSVVAAPRTGPQLSAEAWSARLFRIFYSVFRNGSSSADSVSQSGGAPLREVTDANSIDVATDGGQVVYARDEGAVTNLFLARVDGTGNRRLTGSGGFAPRFSQDGTRIVFSRLAGSGTAAQSDLFTIRTDGTGLARVTARGDSDDFLAAFSPDARRLLFTRFDFARRTAAVYSVGVDGRGLRLVRSGAAAPDWAANGWVSYLVTRADGRSQVAVRAPGVRSTEMQLTRETSAITALRFAR